MSEFFRSSAFIGFAGTILGAIIGAIITVFATQYFTKKNSKEADIRSRLERALEENKNLKSRRDCYEAIEPATEGDFYLVKQTQEKICPVCWRDRHKAIPIYENTEADVGYYVCSCCKNKGIFNRIKVQTIQAENEAATQEMWRNINRITGIDRDPYGNFRY